MNKSNWHATVGAGTLLGDLDERLHKAGGRAIAHGTCPQVGIGGMLRIQLLACTQQPPRTCHHRWPRADFATLGLGSRSHRRSRSRLGKWYDHTSQRQLAPRCLLCTFVTVGPPRGDAHVNQAMKGAAASFGIVTEFVFKTYPEPTNEMVHFSYNIQCVSSSSHFDPQPSLASPQTRDPCLNGADLRSVAILDLRSQPYMETRFPSHRLGTIDDHIRNLLRTQGRV